jgi:hypothetical protein
MGRLGPCGREGKGPEEERERGVESRAGPREWAALFYSFSFPLFFTLTIQTKPFEFK